MLWREQRLIVEVDGWEFHRGRVKFEHDHARDATLIAQGWIVIRFTAEQVNREPYGVIAQIAAALAQSARQRAP